MTTKPKTTKRLSRQGGLVVVAALVIPGLLTFLFLSDRRQSNPYEEMLREGATKRGIDPEKVVKLNRLELLITGNKADAATWAEMEKLRQDPNPTLRHDVYGIASVAYKKSSQAQAISFIEHMKDDPDPEIKARYAWELMLVGAPNWRTVCEQQQNSSDPEASRLAKEALDRGGSLGR